MDNPCKFIFMTDVKFMIYSAVEYLKSWMGSYHYDTNKDYYITACRQIDPYSLNGRPFNDQRANDLGSNFNCDGTAYEAFLTTEGIGSGFSLGGGLNRARERYKTHNNHINSSTKRYYVPKGIWCNVSLLPGYCPKLEGITFSTQRGLCNKSELDIATIVNTRITCSTPKKMNSYYAVPMPPGGYINQASFGSSRTLSKMGGGIFITWNDENGNARKYASAIKPSKSSVTFQEFLYKEWDEYPVFSSAYTWDGLGHYVSFNNIDSVNDVHFQ